MTRRRNRRPKKTRGLKALLLTASVIATIGGARLLELQEPVQADSNSQIIPIAEPAAGSSSGALTLTSRKPTIELKPIPQAEVPHLKPVARARSSM